MAVAARTSAGKPASLKVATGVKCFPAGASSRVRLSSSRRASTSLEEREVMDAAGV